MGDDKKKKIAIAGIASILLVAAVVGVVVATRKGGASDGANVGSTTKAVQAMCGPTSYKQTCEQTLTNANTSNPKELIKIAFDAAVQNISDALKNSATLKEAAADQSTKDAFNVCEKVLETAVEDLRQSFDRVDEFDAAKANEYVEDLRTWMSAVVTNQETCIDAFENTTGDSGEKMKNLLKSAREMSSNGLAMASHISSIITSLGFGNATSRRRRMTEKIRFDEHFVNERILAAAKKGPNAVVALDGSGQFKSIKAALATVPKKNNSPFIIYIKAGLYKEYVSIPKGANQVILVGDGPTKTRITGNKNFARGVKTFESATVAVEANLFFARDIAFENTAGPAGHQAVALRVSGDMAVFFNVAIDGYQDTLYAHTNRQYYRDCYISGTIDFIFGDALSIFQNCKFIVRKPGPNQACMITAQGRVDLNSNGAIVIQNGNIVAEPAFLSAKPMPVAYLGRPWKKLSRTIIMQSFIDAFIAPEGWSPWAGTFALDTLYYGEYANRGPGSDTTKRVPWKGIKKITPQIAQSWTGGKAYGSDVWVRNAGVPYVPTLMKV